MNLIQSGEVFFWSIQTSDNQYRRFGDSVIGRMARSGTVTTPAVRTTTIGNRDWKTFQLLDRHSMEAGYDSREDRAEIEM
jgi:hypothetical protein